MSDHKNHHEVMMGLNGSQGKDCFPAQRPGALAGLSPRRSYAALTALHQKTREVITCKLQGQRCGAERGALPQASLGLFPCWWSNLDEAKHLDAHRCLCKKTCPVGLRKCGRGGCLLLLQPACQVSPPVSAKPSSTQPPGKPPPRSETLPSPDPPHLIPAAKDQSLAL